MNLTDPTPLKNEQNERQQIISYKTLRIMMGMAGILLPLLVFLGKALSLLGTRLEFSISDYYDDDAGGDILVGVLFTLSFFLFAYKGPEPVDNKIANAGAVMAMGVALFPTTSAKPYIYIPHFVFAILLFTVFIIFSLYLFRKTKKSGTITPQKKKRNKVYLVCGIIMIISIVGMFAGYLLLPKETVARYRIIFWGEAIALMAFGVSWLTKAEWLFLVDRKPKS